MFPLGLTRNFLNRNAPFIGLSSCEPTYRPRLLSPSSPQLARIMAILQQQRHQQQGGAAAVGANSKLSPSHLGAGLSKQPMVDPLQHSGIGALSDLHAKNQGMYSGEFDGTFRSLAAPACSLIPGT